MVRMVLRGRMIGRLGIATIAAIGFAAAARADTPAVTDDGPCAAMTREVNAQIEEMKRSRAAANQLKAPVDPKAGDVHIFDELAAQSRGNRDLLSRERRQVDTLNDMLPALGCTKVDIDRELKKPLDPSIPPRKENTSGKKHKKKEF